MLKEFLMRQELMQKTIILLSARTKSEKYY